MIVRHMFSYNGDIIHSYDVCANCEAHAILLQLNKLSLQVNNLSNDDLKLITNSKFSTLLNMSSIERGNNINFINCPS